MTTRNCWGLPPDMRKFYRTHWEIWPILALVSAALCLYAGTTAYMLTSRPDVQWTRGLEIRKRQSLTNPNVKKVHKPRDVFPPNPELAAIYKEMEKKQRERDRK